MRIDSCRVACLAAMVIVVAGLIEGTGLAKQQPGPPVASERAAMIDAFLPKPVNSTDELVAVLAKDRRLRQRYARHFNISESRIIDFVKNTLIVDRLKTDRLVTNYCITRTGRVYSLRQTFKKGIKVWALRDGTPILRWACANPLTKRLPMTLSLRRPRLSPTPTVAGEKPRTIEKIGQPEIPVLNATIAGVEIADPVAVDISDLMAAADVSAVSAVTGGAGIPGRLPTVPLTTALLPLLGTLLPPSSHSLSLSAVAVPEPGSLFLSALALPFLVRKRQRLLRKKEGDTVPPENTL